MCQAMAANMKWLKYFPYREESQVKEFDILKLFLWTTIWILQQLSQKDLLDPLV
jgi:hypothetical protein